MNRKKANKEEAPRKVAQAKPKANLVEALYEKLRYQLKEVSATMHEIGFTDLSRNHSSTYCEGHATDKGNAPVIIYAMALCPADDATIKAQM